MNIATNNEHFNNLVTQELKTTSRIIAEAFGKHHKDVLRAVRNLECSADFNERNFALVEYLDAKGETRTEYGVTRDGFTFLAMGFTGKEAASWKEKFIAAFNAMESKIKQGGGFRLPQSFGEALRLAADQHEQIEELKPKALALDRLDCASGALTPRPASKVLGYPEQKLIKWLTSNNWAFRSGGKGPLQGYSEKLNVGYLDHKLHTYEDAKTGEDKTSIQMLITAKGLARLAKVLPLSGGAA